MSNAPLTPDRVKALAERSVARGLTAGFQALLAATIQSLNQVVAPLRDAQLAALSMGQKGRVAALDAELRASMESLYAGLSSQARLLVDPPERSGSGFRDAMRPKWVPKLRAKAGQLVHRDGPAPEWGPSKRAVEAALMQTAAHLDTLVFGQPSESSASLLGQQISSRLRAHYANLEDESSESPAGV